MINIRAQAIALPDRAASPVKRIGPRAFLIACGVQAVVLAVVIVWMLSAGTVQRVPLVRSGDYAAVREAILARMSNTVGDPLVEITPGVSARESNVRGFSLNGQTYYYYLEGQRSFDPLSRGAVDASGTEIIARDAGVGRMLVIYRVLNNS